MRKQLLSLCPKGRCEVADHERGHRSLVPLPRVEAPGNISQLFRIRMKSFEGRGKFQHGECRTPCLFIDTFCLGRGVLRGTNKAVNKAIR